MMFKLEYVRQSLTIFFIFCLSHHCVSQETTTDTIRIYFEFDRYQPELSGMQKLDMAFSLSQQSLDDILSISVMGYADTIGTKSYNMQLARRRSMYVRNFIINNTVIQDVKGDAYGELYTPGISQDSSRKVDVILERRVSRRDSTDFAASVKKASTLNPTLLSVDTVIVMNDILFEPDRPILTQGSAYRLTRYLQVLSAYGHRRIEVRGHVNHTDSELEPGDPLFKLSVDRAKLVHDWLIDNGIPSDQLVYRGLGNSELLYVSPKNLQEKLLNMRVEIIIYK